MLSFIVFPLSFFFLKKNFVFLVDGSNSICGLMTIDLENVETAEWLCGGDTGCYNAEIWCPFDNVDSCHLIGDGAASNMFDGVQVHVDESFTYGFLDIECALGDNCGTVDVNCEGNMDVNSDILLYDDSDGEYHCSNGGASYCCPLGNCSVFNDPEMGFDSDLLDIDQYLGVTPTTSMPTNSLLTNEPTPRPTDSVIASTLTDLQDVGWGPFDVPLGHCEGDCDEDSDCRDDMICFLNGNLETNVPNGCSGTATVDFDYCYLLTVPPTVSPTVDSQTIAPTTSSPAPDPITSPPTGHPTASTSFPTSNPLPTTIFVVNDTVELLERTLNCTEKVCVIRCLNLLSCAYAQISSNSTETILECDDSFSCLGTTFTAGSTALAQSVKILCLGMF